MAFVSDFFRGDFKSLKKLREGTTVAALYRTTFEQNGSTQLEFVAFGEKAVCQYDSEKDSDLRLVLFKDYLTQLEVCKLINYNIHNLYIQKVGALHGL